MHRHAILVVVEELEELAELAERWW